MIAVKYLRNKWSEYTATMSIYQGFPHHLESSHVIKISPDSPSSTESDEPSLVIKDSPDSPSSNVSDEPIHAIKDSPDSPSIVLNLMSQVIVKEMISLLFYLVSKYHVIHM